MIPPFRALLKRAFTITGRGTVLGVDLVEGKVRVGDRLVVPTLDGRAHVVEVLGVDFLDFDIGRPTARAEVALTVGDLAPGDVAVGQELRTAD